MRVVDCNATTEETSLTITMTFSPEEKEALVRAQAFLVPMHIDEDAYSYDERSTIVTLVECVGHALR